jgi:hypothetical protein
MPLRCLAALCLGASVAVSSAFLAIGPRPVYSDGCQSARFLGLDGSNSRLRGTLMRKSIGVCLLAAIAAFAADARAVTINWTPFGNAGNANDGTGFGAVGYSYNIGTYDVTASQYVEFLNAKDASGLNPLGLYNSNMSNVTNGDINFNNGNLPGSKYSVISGRGNYPVNYETW